MIGDDTDSGAIGEEQCVFKSSRGCVDQRYAVGQVSKKYKERTKDVYWTNINLEKNV